MNNAYIYAGIAIGIAAIAGGVVYATQQQQMHISPDAVKAPATLEGAIPSKTGAGPVINKEQWHEDPFGDLAKKVREKAGK